MRRLRLIGWRLMMGLGRGIVMGLVRFMGGRRGWIVRGRCDYAAISVKGRDVGST